ncbi:MAG: 50S ribosomal protein L13 [Mesoaciditoga sp.]|uniref:50S ribosomal protein L13 n=1 Tax=Athalassotoga sp. TaxID=2022597 RepID=UPI000CC91585|nr:MAG: 50S ribosomal protein L13 [Mesoaciditoga sp.]PMP80698.1 MAG: 50S ribosomal protein L13 [Mesoaciditoga sp.]HEU24567.1 50S ribosomal protein L13 [Mesoaciditoga lauensis]
MSQKTYLAKPGEVEKKWYVIDAAGKPVGRLAVDISRILMGKNKVTYTPHVDNGDFVIVINADKVVLTGNKLDDKVYRRHSGYPGRLKEIKARDMLASHPERVIEITVKGMMPKNVLGRHMLKKLKVYSGSEHPHMAQKPQPLSINL